MPAGEKTVDSVLEKIQQKFFSRTKKSKEVYDDARQHLPGGVSGNAKFMKPYPVYMVRAEGSKIYDVDGNEYVDTLMGGGPHIFGHVYGPIVEAVKQQIDEATNLLVATELEVELAKKIKKHMPHMERVRFLNSGSEATFMAMRAARAYTKREKIAKFEGNYHGQFDYVTISSMTIAGPETNPEPSPDCAGIPKKVLETVLVLPFNNVEVAASLIQKNAKDLAAVIIEPVSMFMSGCVLADVEFLKALREVTSEEDIPLVYDEVVTNFRLGIGGAAEYFGVTPDMSVLGKVVGGGFPLGGYGGRADILEKVVTPTKEPSDVKEKIFHSGTFTGNPVAMVAGIKMIEEIERNNPYPYINEMARRYQTGLEGSAKNLNVDLRVNRAASCYHIHFTRDPVRSRRDMQTKTDLKKQYVFSLGNIVNGVWLVPLHPGFMSTAHTGEDLERMLSVGESILEELRGV